MLLLQPLTIGATLGLAALLIGTTRWIVVFPALVLLIAAWLGQAIHAHRRAVARGAAVGGEMQLAWLLPVILAVVTAFWLFGGGHGSPAAALHDYVAAWRGGRADTASGLFVRPPSTDELAVDWAAHDAYIRQRIGEAASLYGAGSGLDPANPFGGLRFLALDGHAEDTATIAVDIVRRQRVERTLFGIIPTATQETVLVERAGLIRLRALPAQLPAWLPLGRPPPRVWRIEAVDVPDDPAGNRAGLPF